MAGKMQSTHGGIVTRLSFDCHLDSVDASFVLARFPDGKEWVQATTLVLRDQSRPDLTVVHSGLAIELTPERSYDLRSGKGGSAYLSMRRVIL